MARKPRIQFPGAVYLITNNGNRDQRICGDDEDYGQFLATLAEAALAHAWSVMAFCVAPNEFQLVLETPNANLVAGMKWFLTTYALRFNRRNKVTGHLFAGRYKSLLIDKAVPGAVGAACDSVHLLPVRLGLINIHQKLREFRWSSYRQYVDFRQRGMRWLRLDLVLQHHGLLQDSQAARRQFELIMETQRYGEDDVEWEPQEFSINRNGKDFARHNERLFTAKRLLVN